MISAFEITTVCGVNCYALISGYVGIFSKHNYSSIVTLWLQVLFYSVSISIVFRILYPEKVSSWDVLFSFFPILSTQYWYFTSYFILFLFMPLLNYALNHSTKKQIGLFFALLLTFITVLAPIYNTVFGEDVFYLKGGFTAWWLIILYLLGGYIRKYNVLFTVKKWALLVVFFISTAITYASKTVLQFVDMRLFGERRFTGVFGSYTSITVLVSAVALLLLFSRIRVSASFSKIIGFFAPLTFGIYLIHENQYMIPNLFGLIRKTSPTGITMTLLLIVGSTIAIYFCCTLIESMRFCLFKLLRIKKLLEKSERRLSVKLDKHFGQK